MYLVDDSLEETFEGVLAKTLLCHSVDVVSFENVKPFYAILC